MDGRISQDEAKAFGVISWAAAAVLAKATKVIVKTPHEAMGVPTKEANAAGLRATKQLVSMLKDQDFRSIPAVVAESDIIMKEMRCILEKWRNWGKATLLWVRWPHSKPECWMSRLLKPVQCRKSDARPR